MASTPNVVDGEVLESWDLSRYRDNPIVLWMHDVSALPVGRAEEIEETPEGLRVRVRLASAASNPRAEEIWNGIREGIIRAVSVGFEPGPAQEEERDGKTVKVRRANSLHELSFVTVPADQNALVIEETEEERRARVSKAASDLAKSRPRAARTDADVMRLDVMRLDTRLERVERTSIGGAKIPARLTRTGVLRYRNPDGTERRELRLPDEVFKADSLATLKDVPVIDIKDHTGLVTPETWKRAALGHIPEARRDGEYVAADVVVQDKATLDAIERGERIDISCGYSCRLEHTSGVYKGERYDCIQRDIRYNHAALCPPNRGRAGPEVGLRLDTNQGAPAWGVSHFDSGEDQMKMIRLDGKDYEFGSEAHIAKAEEMAAAKAQAELRAELQPKLDSAGAELAEANKAKADAEKARDEAQGRCDAAEARAKKSEEEAEKAKKKFEEEEEEEMKAERARSLRLIRNLVRALRIKGLRMTEEIEKKLDADLESWVTMGDGAERAIMLDAIRADGTSFDDKDKSDDYVRSRFDSTFDAAKEKRSVHGVTREIIRQQNTETTRTDVSDDDPVLAAQKKHGEWTKTAHVVK